MGTVVDISISGITTEKAFYPVVEFKTDTGNKIRFRGSTGSGYSPSYQQGQIVKVIYSRGVTEVRTQNPLILAISVL